MKLLSRIVLEVLSACFVALNVTSTNTSEKCCRNVMPIVLFDRPLSLLFHSLLSQNERNLCLNLLFPSSKLLRKDSFSLLCGTFTITHKTGISS